MQPSNCHKLALMWLFGKSAAFFLGGDDRRIKPTRRIDPRGGSPNFYRSHIDPQFFSWHQSFAYAKLAMINLKWCDDRLRRDRI
ncbi:uncharacterized protein PHALS_14883 [Plasmopara halstedii]|uniref:RxLR-like protein n=1 Tax=Plasmopara halstedii TaxID=4781 RepID=A0A0P1A653_PLAHL|nr:uncharacterized protein PHALS_14883 [Plasmopara halstedii]CEG35890.1 hypothetical protein PHALS_14883 [Plasmopara halstedii]|eukprot:XP_024572259.1 hypothetical protein PHALS_14883 [Plasmopara halstedii]